MKRIEWSAPAEVSPATTTATDPPGGPGYHRPECDCFWHRRRFTHIRLGPPIAGPDWEANCLPLERKVTRTDYGGARIAWSMEIATEGCLFTVGRLVYLDRVSFWATAGRRGGTPANGGAVRLDPWNDHSRRPEGGDPTLIWDLPPQVGRAVFPAESQLVVWQEAWWWHPVLVDGRLVDPLVAPRLLPRGQSV